MAKGGLAAFGDPVSGKALAQDAVTTSIATKIGASIASSLGNQIATLAFGQFTAAIGIDIDGAAAMRWRPTRFPQPI
jgi:hypothetical protein